jgi:dipeptidyl aminopeptidase/acylaminoacyl peptidase
MRQSGEGTQISHVLEAPGDPQWSPDGKWVGFTMFVPKAAKWDIDLPAPPEGANWTPAPRYVDRLHFRQDREGFQRSGLVHLFVIPADGGTPRDLTPGEWSVGVRFDGLVNGANWSWRADGKTIVVDGLNDADADFRFNESNIFTVDINSGAARGLTPAKGTWTSPLFSPDGSQIAFVGLPSPANDSAYHASALYVMNADGSGLRDLSSKFDRDPEELRWAADGSAIYFTAQDRGSINVHRLALKGCEKGACAVEAITTGAQALSLGSLSKNGIAAITRSAPKEPRDIYRLDLRRMGAPVRLTHTNDATLARIHLGEVEEVWYQSAPGVRVQGWIVKPPGFDAKKTYPLILSIHGGPQAMSDVGFSYAFQNWAANGFVVLYTNPRGSTGYGTAFGNAINHNYPGPDYTDLMAGVDTLIGRGYVDTQNLFVTGCSGGGVLTSWVIGHTTRFAAAAVRCPVIDWISMAGETDIPLFTHGFFEKPFWEQPDMWLKESPLMYVGNVTTPTVLMTGELDRRTPMPQTEEYYVALKMRHVPTALLRFAGEFHGTGSKPSNFMRTQLYVLSWFRKYGKGLN